MKSDLRGISLITLIITIVVVIILAAAIILSLSGNNPINNARVANLDQTKDGIESSILTYTGKAQSETLGYYTVAELITGNREETESYGIIGDEITINKNGEEIYNIDKTKFESKIDTLPSTPTKNSTWYVDSNGHVYLVFEKKENLASWMTNKDGELDDTLLNKFVAIKTWATLVAQNPLEYYGAEVTNYIANGVSNWKIFHSDGRHIYLISSDYIPLTSVPKTKGDLEIKNQEAEYTKSAPLTPAITDSNYVGSDSIKNTSVRKWLSYISEYPQSTKPNMQAVAYLLDTEVWNCFKIEGKADYAIGGPTLEMLAASYNKIHESKKIEYKITENGYDVKWSTDESFDGYISGIKPSESLYILPSYKTSGADAMWLASPSVGYYSHLKGVYFSGHVSTPYCGDANVGFRPIVCLSSGVQMEQNDDGSVSIN